MPGARVRLVADDEVVALEEEDGAAVRDGVGQAAVAVVLALKEVEARAAHPRARLTARRLRPAEGSGDDGRGFAVYDERVVRRGVAEVVAQFARAGVSAGARVNEERAAAGREREGERVGVRVAAVHRAVRAAVEERVVRVTRP